jgi:thioredoxin-dependent peroxiredoxin
MYKLVLRLDVGGRAEDFMLNDSAGKPVRLSDLLGKGIIFLTFYRGGFDPESLRYLKALAGCHRKLRELGVDVVAITPELPGKVKSTVAAMNLPFTVLSDPELKVTKQYDVYNAGMEWCWPAAFVIDRDGVIQYAYRGISPPNTPPVQYLVRKFEQMHKKELEAGTAAATAR